MRILIEHPWRSRIHSLFITENYRHTTLCIIEIDSMYNGNFTRFPDIGIWFEVSRVINSRQNISMILAKGNSETVYADALFQWQMNCTPSRDDGDWSKWEHIGGWPAIAAVNYADYCDLSFMPWSIYLMFGLHGAYPSLYWYISTEFGNGRLLSQNMDCHTRPNQAITNEFWEVHQKRSYVVHKRVTIYAGPFTIDKLELSKRYQWNSVVFLLDELSRYRHTSFCLHVAETPNTVV